MDQGSFQTRKTETPNEREQEILWYLHESPNLKDLQIANKMSINETQVRYARESMVKRGWIKENPRVDLAMLGFPERYRVDIWIDHRELKRPPEGRQADSSNYNSQRLLALYIVNTLATEARFKPTILIEDILILLGGEADLTAIVRAKNNNSMLEFVTEGIRMCRGVARTLSCLELRSYLSGTL